MTTALTHRPSTGREIDDTTNHHRVRWPVQLCGLLLLFCIGADLQAMETSLFELPLEELLTVVVVSPSRQARPLAESATAIHVIRNSEIRRSGANSVMEALRLAPGVNVARITPSGYAISIRGLNNRFANKLLVLVDGRTIYTPMFGGVYWEVQDFPIEEIERIEVIRGPGASLWGANAMNGVINIITHSPSATGSHLVGEAGSETLARVYASQSGRLAGEGGKSVRYRLYASQDRQDSARLASGSDSRDDWHHQQLGWKMDSSTAGGASFQLQGRIMRGRMNETANAVRIAGGVPVAQQLRPGDTRIEEQHLQFRYTLPLDANEEFQVQASVAGFQVEHPAVIDFYRERTLNLEFQHSMALAARQKLLWGMEFRHTDTDIRTLPQYLAFRRSNRSLQLSSAFVQTETELLEERLGITAGIKLENQEFVGMDWQPSVRALWQWTPEHALWAAVSRALRVPTTSQRDLRYLNISARPGPTLLQLRDQGNGSRLHSEEMLAYELGYRFTPARSVSVDLAFFRNDYEELEGQQPGALECGPSGNSVGGATGPGSVAGCAAAGDTYYVQPLFRNNDINARTWGGELSVNWEPLQHWRLRANYSHYREDFGQDAGSPLSSSGESGSTPRHTVSIRSAYELSPRSSLDAWLRHTDEIPAQSVDAYTTLDMRWSHRLSPDLDINVTGRNLLDAQHPEFIQVLAGNPPTEVERSISIGIDLRF